MIATVPGFVAVKDAIFPLPLVASPMEVLLFVQANVVPAVELVKVTAVVASLLQTVSSGIGSTIGGGFTVMTPI